MIVASGTPSALAAKEATAAIPIVFFVAGDPVELGLVARLNRPSGNLTCMTTLTLEVASKWLELLHELMPTTSTVALLINPTSPALAKIQSRDLQAAARNLGMQIRYAVPAICGFSPRQCGELFAAMTPYQGCRSKFPYMLGSDCVSVRNDWWKGFSDEDRTSRDRTAALLRIYPVDGRRSRSRANKRLSRVLRS